MSRKSNLMKVTPPGLVSDRCASDAKDLAVCARGASTDAACPGCGGVSARVHSRCPRTLRDLPAHGRRVPIRLAVRRFRCAGAPGRRRTTRDRPSPRSAVTALGTDDRAWRKRKSYGTIICDLRGHRVLALLADRDMARVEAWLARRREVTAVAARSRRHLRPSRDEGAGQGDAGRRPLAPDG